MGPIGVPELILIFLIALLVFGPKKLPELGRTLGKALTEFRRASSELRHAVEDEISELDRQTAETRRQAEEALSGAEIGGSVTPPAPAQSAPVDPSPPEEKPAHGDAKPA